MYWRLLLVFVMLFLHGCAKPVPKEIPAAEITPPPKPAMQVVILVSEDIPAYSDVAKALARQLGKRSNIHYLGKSQAENLKMVAAYNNDEYKQLVSIGLNAAVVAKGLTNRQVVFCQVFNYQDYDLLSGRHKGVSMTPSPYRIFGTWRALAPNITDIGVISGPGFDDLMQTAKAAARNYGITLHHETVNSDKEYQYAYKQMAGKVQGYWLLPDNRVLSGLVLRDVMTFSVRNSKQVTVFNDELLKLGGLLSISSDTPDVAQQVVERLEQGPYKEVMPGPDIVYPDKVNLHINSVMAQRFNLPIPAPFKKYADTP
jgi:ABC-type uncharacterized transport system substrate-binding protein